MTDLNLNESTARDELVTLLSEHDYDMSVPDGGGVVTWGCAAGDGPDDETYDAHLAHLADVLLAAGWTKEQP